jgi:ubiquinone/menaquinone biosynthesis C-methylase UbiE
LPPILKGVEVIAVDFSNEMIIRAKIAAADNQIKTEFIHSDVESVSPDLYH